MPASPGDPGRSIYARRRELDAQAREAEYREAVARARNPSGSSHSC